MKTSTLVIVSVIVSISVLTWLISIWQYDEMMLSMMMFYSDPVVLSLFTAIWTAGMAAMMFPAIIPMILVYNRLIDTKNNSAGKSDNDRECNGNNYTRHSIEETEGSSSNVIHSLRYKLKLKSINILIFVSSYLAIWALTGIVLLVGWSFLFDALLFQFQLNDSQQQQQLVSVSSIYGIVLIISGIYQFSSLKTRCLGYCESPLSFFMRRWQRGKIGAFKMGAYHGIYCLGCCWPYFLLMVALGWMNVLWMGLFAAIIFAEKVWTRGGLWTARITGIGFIVFGILSLTGIVSMPSDSMSSSDNNNDMLMMDKSTNMDVPSSSSDNMISHGDSDIARGSSPSIAQDLGNNTVNNNMKNMIMK